MPPIVHGITQAVNKVLIKPLLGMPDISASASPLLILNPINIFRGVRLAKRITRNPDDATLEEVLPPELYARFAALQTQYFPRNDDFEKVRPLVAGGRMTTLIQEEEGLVSGGDIMKMIRRLIRRNRDIERTEKAKGYEVREP